MESVLKTKRVLKTRLSRVQSAIEAQVMLSPLDALAYLDKVNQLEEDFNKLLLEVSYACDDQQYSTYEMEFNELDTKLHVLKVRLCGSTTPQPATNKVPTSSTAELRLPKIELPSFSGNFEQWLTFHDLFVASIHNNSNLSGAQKLQYLKTSVKGEAAVLIQSIPIADINYKEAWDILVERYQNVRKIVNAHLDRLLTQSSISDGSAVSLRKLVDTVNECVRAIRVHGVPIEHWDVILVHIISKLLDNDSRREWELSLVRDELPTYQKLMQFLDQRAHALAAATSTIRASAGPGIGVKPFKPSKHAGIHHGAVGNPKCQLCKGDHMLYKCSDFLKLAITERQAIIGKFRLCYNCLRSGHQVQQCNGGRCRVCNGHHHTLIHKETTLTPRQADQAVVTHHQFNKPTHAAQVLLSTALLNVLGADGEFHTIRALLDSASQASLITENCVRRLGLPKSKTMVSITGVNIWDVAISHASVQLTLSPVNWPSKSFVVEALVLTKLTTMQPSSSIDHGDWTHLKSLPLADPKYFEPGHIDVLLGADVYADLLEGGVCRGPAGSPTAVQTSLGWILMGKLSLPAPRSITSHHVQYSTDAAIHQFWDMEEDQPTRFFTHEESLCEDHFKTTHSRDNQGRFIVRLPFRTGTVDLGASRDIAIRRLKQVERRLAESTDLRHDYVSFMKEYCELGHMEPIPSQERSLPAHLTYYLPHHAVFKAASTTTKLRVVFDASARTTTGVSLNDKLMVGPKLQDNIVPLMMRFRNHLIALTADITKMYRQVRIHPADADFQRIVWREYPDQPIKDFRLLTVTYGTSSAPYQATKCLQQLAEDQRQTWPVAARILSKDFYVDDLLSGASSIQEAIQLQLDLTQLLASGGFKLCKWSSNSIELLETIPSEFREISLPLLISGDQTVKALGINWHPGADSFSFVLPIFDQHINVTKRTLLSNLAKLYDPLGWLSPTTIQAKILFQSLWKLDLSWDQSIPAEYLAQWKCYQQELPCIQDLAIPRCITDSSASSWDLHAFCDASERAFAAVIYMRSSSLHGQPKVSLIASKTKVAPLKMQSLPRLELCGAVLLSRLVKLVKQSMNVPGEIYAYSDSTITLAWLSASPAKWKTFVANRVNEVQVSIPEAHWRHISTHENPADCASRGISPQDLVKFELWWNGPKFLHDQEHPVFTSTPDVSRELLDLEKRTCITLHSTSDLSMMSLYSSLSKLLRVTAWCLRFYHNARALSGNRIHRTLTVKELHHALLRWIKLSQRELFHEDIHRLESGMALSVKSRIACLNPFLDHEGLLRVGGRLSKSYLSEDMKHPILMDSKHILTKLIISQEHITSLHAGAQLVLAGLQRRYWILNGRDTVRGVIRKCVTCHRQRAAMAGQMMGNLPAARVTPSRPFSQCGIDYAGPLLLRVLKGRGHKMFKGYVSLFVCFATRAIHLELVSDLSTAAFIASLKRFVARRGKPSTIYSDCGTNFIGAAKELRELGRFVRGSDFNDTMSHHLLDLGIEWKFNPPAAPHFGGLWEAGIRSMKHHLKKIVGNAILNFEEMTTVLVQIEACLNSRPLSAISSDPNDMTVLTPGHFLVGGPLLALPEPDFTSCQMNRLSRWQYSQHLVQHFWHRWSCEYLSRLQQRPKWWTRKENLRIGDLVLIKEDPLPPLKWKLGRILQLHPGDDGLVRAVTLKTASGQLCRPVVKLSPLPLDTDSEQSG